MRKISRRKFIARGVMASIGLVLLDSYWFEKYIIDWNYFDISNAGDNKIKIIQITDLHFDKLRSFHRSIARKINEIKPDLVFITGDSVDKTEKIEPLATFLQLIDTPIKKYAITGNWEYWGDVDLSALKKMYSKYNCSLLINENRSVQVGDRRVSIIGIDDFVGGNANFSAAVQEMPPADTHIVLSHCPEHRDFIIREKEGLHIDLILSGHTHGGQITFLGIVPFKPPGSGRYLKGWYRDADTKMYVSKGIGTSMVPFRLGARAEMVVMDV